MLPLQTPPAAAEMGRILRFWHKVEFFIPYDLQQQVLEGKDADQFVRSWTFHELPEGVGSLWTFQIPDTHRLVGFDIFLGVFDKSAMTAVVKEALTELEMVEQTERADVEGLTCTAKLSAGTSGEPLLENVSVSTAPWAMGRVQAAGLAALDFDAFESSSRDLALRLQQFRTARAAETASKAEPAEEKETKAADGTGTVELPPRPLSGSELKDLLALFQEWAGWKTAEETQGKPVLVIRARTRKKPPQNGNPEVQPVPTHPRANIPAVTRTADAPQPNGADEDGDEDEDESKNEEVAEPEIDILNSFFAKDIAIALRALEREEGSAALQAYLTPCPPDRRLDLYSPAGRARIRDTLEPARLPAAHWPDEPGHAMSLMQQFAINSLLDRLKDGGIFSVNGPPGTGKTTLLRDVFAELVTRRARVLSSLERPGDAFTGTQRVSFNDGTTWTVSLLRPELTGYEMVVASSNNAAVENLSRDLPKSRALGRKAWRGKDGTPEVRYLQTVAHNIAADDGKGGYQNLAGGNGQQDDVPWGLIAAALGKKANRTRVADGLRFDGSSKNPKPREFNPSLHQSLWSWQTAPGHVPFTTARDRFKAADAAVSDRIRALENYAQLGRRLRGQTLTTFTEDSRNHVNQMQRRLADAKLEMTRVNVEIELCEEQKKDINEAIRLLTATKPKFWARWLQPAKTQAIDAELNQTQLRLKDLCLQLADLKKQRGTATTRLNAAEADRRSAEDTLKEQNAEWQRLQQELERASTEFPRVRFPTDDAVLEEDRWQIDGLWRDDTLNRLRSELFVAALGLHEAWLANVLAKRAGFRANLVAISNLLSGKRPLDSSHLLPIWQSLFMIVPVVSSTFASVAAQFRGLGRESIGWLFIDEAGQAVPQAAVGALWRAKRAVVVGDPLQIEPVFTVPIRLIDALAEVSDLPSDRCLGPHQVSVQNLADEANSLGALIKVEGMEQWIGSPLRVHRRCVDPMFSIANQIAYQNKMIFFDPDRPEARQPPAGTLDLGPSAWVRLGGQARDRQVVAEQVSLTCEAIHRLYRRQEGRLPDLYIISPFRRIKQALTEALTDRRSWPAGNQPSASELRKWCKERVGTVHTFQGKEESIVLMVLGCDAQTAGAARWAASKPNLLNVALTRAKHRFFLIGEEALWAGLPNFSAASPDHLPRISPDQFLERVAGN